MLSDGREYEVGMKTLELVEIAFVVILGLNVLAVLLTIGNRTARSIRQRMMRARASRIESMLDEFLATGLVERNLRQLRPQEMDTLAASIIEYLKVLRGSEQERLLHLASEVGLLKRYLGMLRSGRRWQRARGAEYLGFLGGAAASGQLSGLLSDEDETVRAVAARALARVGTQEAARVLAETLSDPSELTRLRVAENLERVGAEAVRPLVDTLSSEDQRSPILAARVIGNLRNHEAGPALEEIVRGDREINLRAQATLALGKIGNPDYVPALLDAAGDEDWPVRAQAANALRMIGDVSAIPTLKELTVDREWWVRLNAARALVNLGDVGEYALVDVLEGPDRFGRHRAAATLEAQGITRRLVEDLAATSDAGERARRAIQAVIRAGSTKHLRRILETMPDGEEHRILQRMLMQFDASQTDEEPVPVDTGKGRAKSPETSVTESGAHMAGAGGGAR